MTLVLFLSTLCSMPSALCTLALLSALLSNLYFLLSNLYSLSLCFTTLTLYSYSYSPALTLCSARSRAKTGETIRVPGGRTIAKNQWFVEVQWYISVSANPAERRYKLEMADIMHVHVPPDALIQEHELEWAHEGRDDGESILSDASHVALMWHNYSNVQ